MFYPLAYLSDRLTIITFIRFLIADYFRIAYNHFLLVYLFYSLRPAGSLRPILSVWGRWDFCPVVYRFIPLQSKFSLLPIPNFNFYNSSRVSLIETRRILIYDSVCHSFIAIDDGDASDIISDFFAFHISIDGVLTCYSCGI